MSQLYLGIDGGGTNTNAVLIDKDKKILSTAQAAGSNINSLGLSIALENLTRATKGAVKNYQGEDIRGLFALAGVDSPKDIKKWNEAFQNKPDLRNIFKKTPTFTNDIYAALRSGTTEKNAIAIICGTGSNCWGINEKGQEAKSSGMSHILSDEGSGYFVGDKILRSITKSLDGRGPKTVLIDLLFDEFKIKSLTDLKELVTAKPWNKAEISSIAPLAEKAAAKNDEVAIQILKDAAHELAIMIKAVATRLNLLEKPYSIVTTGSLFKTKIILNEQFRGEIMQFSPKAKFVTQKIDSAMAAAYLALEQNS